jgi:hypothetical protein
MPSHLLHASLSVHSWEIIFGETVADFCSNSHEVAQKTGETFQKTGETFPHFSENWGNSSENWGNVCALFRKVRKLAQNTNWGSILPHRVEVNSAPRTD